jgi:hypothetical protein
MTQISKAHFLRGSPKAGPVPTRLTHPAHQEFPIVESSIARLREIEAGGRASNTQRRFIPPGAHAHPIPLSQLILDPRARSTRESNLELAESTYNRMVAELRTKMAEHFPKASEVKEVFYPCGASEAYLPFALFPNATTAVIVDNHPFIRANEHINLRYPIRHFLRPAHDCFRQTSSIDEEGYLAARAIASLKASGDNVTIQSIEAFTETDLLSTGSPAVHGIITFDLGDGIERRVIFLNRSIPHKSEGFQDKDFGFLNEFSRQTRPAMIVKASVNSLDVSRLPKGLRQDIVDWLKTRKAILVEGNNTPAHPEFSSTPYEFNGYLRLPLSKMFYGYDGSMSMTLFEKAPNQPSTSNQPSNRYDDEYLEDD